MAAVWPINLRPPRGGRTAKRCKRRSGKWRTRANGGRANGGHARPVFFVGCVGGVVHLFRVVGPEVDVATLQVVGPEIDVAALQVRCSIVSSASFWGRSWAGLWPSCWCRVLRRFGLALVVGFALICLHQQRGGCARIGGGRGCVHASCHSQVFARPVGRHHEGFCAAELLFDSKEVVAG